MVQTTFLLPGEGDQVLPVLMLQGALLQVVLQGVTVIVPRGGLLGLVPLPEARWEHGILGHRGRSKGQAHRFSRDLAKGWIVSLDQGLPGMLKRSVSKFK